VNEDHLLDAYGLTRAPAQRPLVTPDMSTIWPRLRREDGHWIWTGPKTRAGYPELWDHVLVHRLMYQVAYDHLLEPGEFVIRVDGCERRDCVFPGHLGLTNAAGRAQLAAARRQSGPEYRIGAEAKKRRAEAIASAIPHTPVWTTDPLDWLHRPQTVHIGSEHESGGYPLHAMGDDESP